LSDCFLTKYNSDGDYQWTISWGGTSFDESYGVVVDDTAVYVMGTFRGTVDFDPGAGVSEATSAGADDVYLNSFDVSNADFLWMKTWGGTGADSGNGITIDDSGDVYVTGGFQNTVDFDPDPVEKDERTSNGGTDAYVLKGLVWADGTYVKTFGGEGNDIGRGVKSSSNNKIFITGEFKSTVDFNPGTGEDNHTAEGSDANAFLSMFTVEGGYVSAHTFGGDSYTVGNSVATKDGTKIFLTGCFSGTTDFDPGPGNASKTSNGDCDAFLSIFGEDGSFQSVKTIGGQYSDEAYAITTDSAGNPMMAGYYMGSVDFDPGPEIRLQSSKGSTDIFVAKYNPTGEYLWARSFGSPYIDLGNGVAFDLNGCPVVVGEFQNTVDFDPGTSTEEHSSTGSSDVFALKLLPDGNW